MKINRKSMESVLNLISVGVNKDDEASQMSHFIFTKSNAVTFNDRIFVSHPFATDFSFSVNASDFGKVLSKLKEEEFDAVMDNSELVITTTNTEARFSTSVEMGVEKYLKRMEKRFPEKWNQLPDNFLEGIDICKFSVHSNPFEGTISYIKAVGDKVISTDNTRLSIFTMSSSFATLPIVEEMFLPPNIVATLISLNITKYSIDNSWIHFCNDDGVIISTKKIEGEFPDFETILNNSKDGDIVNLPDELVDTIKVVSVMSESDTNYRIVDITISDRKLTCTSKKNRGKIKKEIPIKSKAKAEFKISAKLLLDILGKTDRMRINSFAVFESDNFIHVLSLF